MELQLRQVILGNYECGQRLIGLPRSACSFLAFFSTLQNTFLLSDTVLSLIILTSPFRRHYDRQADPSYLLPGCYSNSGGCSLSTQQCSPSSQQRVQILISCTRCEGTRNGKDATIKMYCQNILYIWTYEGNEAMPHKPPI
jgi:hypothetical protein